LAGIFPLIKAMERALDITSKGLTGAGAGLLRQVAFPMVLLIVLFAGAGIVNPQFLSWDSLRIQLTLAAFIGIVGIGQTLAILIGQIDLSIPANISLSAILSANVYGQTLNPILSLLAGSSVGVVAGLLNGIGIARLRVPSLIWSLGMNLVLQGATLVYTDTAAPSSTIAPFARWIVTGTSGGVPMIVIFWVLLSIVCLVVLHCTAFGRRIYALGNNELASAMSGINVFRVYFPVYLISGLAASITGILLSGYSGQTYLGMGESYLLIPIAAVVIGGTTLAGGRGGYFGTMIGSVAVVLLDSVLTSLQVSPGLRKIFFGAIIVAMMLLFRRKRDIQ
jgi:ribose transport system permease protein